jgi:hypothetical protein
MKAYRFQFFQNTPLDAVYVPSRTVTLATGVVYPRTTRWDEVAKERGLVSKEAVSIRRKNKTWLRVDLANSLVGRDIQKDPKFIPALTWKALREASKSRNPNDTRPGGGARAPFPPMPPEPSVPVPIPPGVRANAEAEALETLLGTAAARLRNLRFELSAEHQSAVAELGARIRQLETELTALRGNSAAERVEKLEFENGQLRKDMAAQTELLGRYQQHAANWLQLTASGGTWSMQAVAAALAIPHVNRTVLFRYLRQEGEFIDNSDGEESCIPKAIDFKRLPAERRWHFVANVQISGGPRLVGALRVRGPGLDFILKVLRKNGHVIPSDKLIGIHAEVERRQKELDSGSPRMPV